MAGLNDSGQLALRIFRHMEPVTAAALSGDESVGKGIVSAFQRGKGDYGGERHALGNMGLPLYRFTGWLPEWEKLSGGTLVQGGVSYRVLEAAPVMLGGRMICVRAVLEKEAEHGDQ